MRYLKTSEAAALLKVSPNTLAGLGAPVRLPQAAALARQAPAVHARRDRRAARRAPGGPVDLVRCFPRARGPGGRLELAGRRARFRTSASAPTRRSRPPWRCGRSSGRSKRSCCRPSTRCFAGSGCESAAWAFAAHWASRLAAARDAAVRRPRCARSRSSSATPRATSSIPTRPYIRALELFCVRAGINVLSLSARGVAGIGDAVSIHRSKPRRGRRIPPGRRHRRPLGLRNPARRRRRTGGRLPPRRTARADAHHRYASAPARAPRGAAPDRRDDRGRAPPCRSTEARAVARLALAAAPDQIRRRAAGNPAYARARTTRHLADSFQRNRCSHQLQLRGAVLAQTCR